MSNNPVFYYNNSFDLRLRIIYFYEMHLIIIGHTGFIGKELVNLIKKKKLASRISKISSKQINLLNNSSIKKLSKMFSENCYIVFCAGIKRQLGDDLIAYKKNLQIITNLAKSLNENVSKIVFFSSAAVYGEDKTRSRLITELTKVSPSSFYGIGKISSEYLLQKVCNDLKINLTIIRPPLIYGKGDQSRGYGPTKFICNALEKKEVILWGDGSELREFVYYKDVINITYLLLISNHTGLFNLVSGESYTYKKVTEILQSKFKNMKINNKSRSRPKINIKFSNDKLKKIIKNYKFFNLKEGISDFINSYEKK